MKYSVLEASYRNPLVVIKKIPGNIPEIPGLFIFETENTNQLYIILKAALYTSWEERDKIKATQKEFVRNKFDLSDWVKK